MVLKLTLLVGKAATEPSRGEEEAASVRPDVANSSEFPCSKSGGSSDKDGFDDMFLQK